MHTRRGRWDSHTYFGREMQFKQKEILRLLSFYSTRNSCPSLVVESQQVALGIQIHYQDLMVENQALVKQCGTQQHCCDEGRIERGE